MSKKHFHKFSNDLGRGEGWVKPKVGGRRVVFDELLIRSEIYNPNDFDIVFYRLKDKDAYTQLSGITLGNEVIVCLAKDFCILPTSFYVPRAFDRGRAGKWEHEIKDTPMQLIRTYGNEIGKGRKNPSAPVLE